MQRSGHAPERSWIFGDGSGVRGAATAGAGCRAGDAADDEPRIDATTLEPITTLLIRAPPRVRGAGQDGDRRIFLREHPTAPFIIAYHR
jgi:hypothetical protein